MALAAQLVAEDAVPDVRIAEKVGVSPSTLARWKVDAAFRERVDTIRHEMQAKLLRAGIAAKQNRVDGYVERHRRLQAVIDARAADRRYAEEPGWSTGLLVRSERRRGAVVEVEFSIDTGLLAEMRALEKQVAQELGEWTEKREVTGANGGPLRVEESPRQALVERVEAIAKRLGVDAADAPAE